MKKNINIESTRRLALVTPNLITHFCRSAARLNGMLALREQFNEEHLDGACSSIAMAEVDSEELRQKIVKCARDCANSLFRMNQQAKNDRRLYPPKVPIIPPQNAYIEGRSFDIRVCFYYTQCGRLLNG